MEEARAITIYVCNGRFLVWDAAVARELALQYRVIGEWSASRSQPTQAAPASDGDLTHSSSEDGFPLETLPLTLTPVQVLDLHRRMPEKLDLVDASSVRAMRHVCSVDVGAIVLERVRAFQSALDRQAGEQAEIARRFQHRRKKPLHTKTDVNEEMHAPCEEDVHDPLGPPSKRPRGAAAASASAPTLDELVATVSGARTTTTVMPHYSGYSIASCAFPLAADVLAAHTPAHPLVVSTPVHHPPDAPPIVMPRTHIALDLRTKIAYPRRMDRPRNSPQATERLLYRGICDALGLRFHTCGSAATHDHTKAGVAADRNGGAFSSSPKFSSFLSLYSSYRHLHLSGFHLLPGLHFGCDLVCYEDLPSRVHSTFLAHVLPDAREDESVSAPHLSLGEVAGLARMASGINKTVLLLQNVRDDHATEETIDQVDDDQQLTSHEQGDEEACACVRAFRRSVSLIHRAHLESTTLHWSLQAGLQHASFPNDHLRDSRPPLKRAQQERQVEKGALAVDE